MTSLIFFTVAVQMSNLANGPLVWLATLTIVKMICNLIWISPNTLNLLPNSKSKGLRYSCARCFLIVQYHCKWATMDVVSEDVKTSKESLSSSSSSSTLSSEEHQNNYRGCKCVNSFLLGFFIFGVKYSSGFFLNKLYEFWSFCLKIKCLFL